MINYTATVLLNDVSILFIKTIYSLKKNQIKMENHFLLTKLTECRGNMEGRLSRPFILAMVSLFSVLFISFLLMLVKSIL